MKTIFIEARSRQKVELPEELIKMLPKRIILFAAVQFLDSLEGISKKLEKAGKKVVLMKEKHVKYPGQLLGCSITKVGDEDFDSFLYIGDGLFHPKALMLKNEKKVFAYNPFSRKFLQLAEGDVDKMKKRMQGALLKFLNSSSIGVLVSTKPGQLRLKDAYALEKKYPSKEFYFLVGNTIDFNDLENYPFIECYINTACPRIAYDDSEKIAKPVVNIDDLDLIN